MNLGQTSSDSAATDAGIVAAIGPDYTSFNIAPADVGASGTVSPASLTTDQVNLLNSLLPASSADVTTPVVAVTAPTATTDPNSLNQMVSFAGQLYQYVQSADAQGNPVYVPQPVSSSVMGMFSNPYVLIGGAALLFLLLS